MRADATHLHVTVSGLRRFSVVAALLMVSGAAGAIWDAFSPLPGPAVTAALAAALFGAFATFFACVLWVGAAQEAQTRTPHADGTT